MIKIIDMEAAVGLPYSADHNMKREQGILANTSCCAKVALKITYPAKILHSR